MIVSPCCSLEDVAMTVEINRSSSSEIHRVALSSSTREQQLSWAPSREPEKANLVDDGDDWPSWSVRRRHDGRGSFQASNPFQSKHRNLAPLNRRLGLAS